MTDQTGIKTWKVLYQSGACMVSNLSDRHNTIDNYGFYMILLRLECLFIFFSSFYRICNWIAMVMIADGHLYNSDIGH